MRTIDSTSGIGRLSVGHAEQIKKSVEDGFPLMPPGCAIRLDEISQQIVLDNLRVAIRNTRKAVIDDLRGLPAPTTLPQFLATSSLDLGDIYSSPASGSTFTSARRAAGHLRGAPTVDEDEFAKAIGKMLHVDDEERYETWRSWLTANGRPAPAEAGSRQERLQWMLFAALGQRRRPLAMSVRSTSYGELPSCVPSWLICSTCFVNGCASIRARSIRRVRYRFHSHATYGLYEIVAGYGVAGNGALRETREGVMWVETHNSDLFFITLNKSDEDYSVSTRYQDYPISPTSSTWESQSRTSTASPTGQRYIHHVARGSRVVLFVRENKRDERDVSTPYLCLGPAPPREPQVRPADADRLGARPPDAG